MDAVNSAAHPHIFLSVTKQGHSAIFSTSGNDDCHANSDKDHRKQIAVCDDICRQLAEGEPRIFGVMIESNLIEGNQSLGDPDALVYGQSITDACLGWEDSERCLRALAQVNG